MTTLPFVREQVTAPAWALAGDLITDRQEIEGAALDLGIPLAWVDDLTGLIEAVADDGNVELWFTESSRPYLTTAQYNHESYYTLEV